MLISVYINHPLIPFNNSLTNIIQQNSMYSLSTTIFVTVLVSITDLISNKQTIKNTQRHLRLHCAVCMSQHDNEKVNPLKP